MLLNWDNAKALLSNGYRKNRNASFRPYKSPDFIFLPCTPDEIIYYHPPWLHRFVRASMANIHCSKAGKGTPWKKAFCDLHSQHMNLGFSFGQIGRSLPGIWALTSPWFESRRPLGCALLCYYIKLSISTLTCNYPLWKQRDCALASAQHNLSTK